MVERLGRDDSSKYDSGGNYISGHTRHGHARHGKVSGEYWSWLQMLKRCHNPKTFGYADYGGRGITICERWLRFDNFLADMGSRPKGTSLDRIDNNGNYEPGNCRWATHKEQSRNKRSNRNITIDGTTRCLKDWADFAGNDYALVRSRLRLGWEPAVAIFCPPLPKGQRKA